MTDLCLCSIIVLVQQRASSYSLLALAQVTQQVSVDLQVHTELHMFHHLLTASTDATVHESLEMEDEDWRQLLQTETPAGLHLLLGVGANVSVQLFTSKVLPESISQTADCVTLNVKLESVEWLESSTVVSLLAALTEYLHMSNANGVTNTPTCLGQFT